MSDLPHDGETAPIVRGKETGAFYLFNADLVHAYMRTTDDFLQCSSFGTYSIPT